MAKPLFTFSAWDTVIRELTAKRDELTENTSHARKVLQAISRLQELWQLERD